jgi:hypothetical protein
MTWILHSFHPKYTISVLVFWFFSASTTALSPRVILCICSMSPTRGDTTLSRLVSVSLDRYCEEEWRLKAPSQQDRQKLMWIDVPRTGDSTWSLRDSKSALIYSRRYKQSQTDSLVWLSHVDSSPWRHTESCYALRHTTSSRVIALEPSLTEPPRSFLCPIQPLTRSRTLDPPMRLWGR